jgi:hypothetical protein
MCLLLAAMLLSSCVVTQKQRDRFLARNCKQESSKSDSIVTKLDTVLVEVPGEQGPPIYLENPCAHLCDSLGNLKPFSITEEKNGIKTSVRSVGNSIVINSATKDTARPAVVTTKEVYSDEKATVPEDCRREHRTWWDHFCFWFTNIVGGAGVLYLAFKWLRRFIPGLSSKI